jgi:hypothetical protein
MTDTTLTPVADPEAPPDAPPPQQAPEQPTPAPAAEVDHTPGGWPVVPLAVTGTNTTATLLGAAALVGGPAALAVAATGAVVVGTAAAARTRCGQRGTARAARIGNGAASGPRGARSGGTGRVPLQKRPTSLSKRNGAGRGAGTAGAVGARGKAAHRAAGAGRAGALPRARTASAGAAAGRADGRMAQARAVREAARAAAPTRAARRAETTGARRAVADARRAAKHQARTAFLDRRGPAGRTAAKALGATSTARRTVVDRARAARDRAAARHLDGQREAVRTAPVRKRARKALWRSAARFQGRRLLAVLLAGALGLIGLVTTPLGRRLGWAWLMYPGRRLYRAMTRTAAEQRAVRDAKIRAALEAEEAAAAAEEDPNEIADRVQRPNHLLPTADPVEVVHMTGFRFEEAAAEMEEAARTYTPDGAMEILAMVENLPAALTSIANTFRILAERADEEFPLEKEVAAGFEDIYAALVGAMDKAEEMGPLFRRVHEADIARHEEPRNGTEAEKGWNV